MKILIADDEKLARQRLRSLVDELNETTDVVAEARNGREALELWYQCRADVLLLDIRMPEIDGLQVARKLYEEEAPPAIIFTTAYDDYALKAFDNNAIDYLLKPIRKNRLQAALAKAAIFRGHAGQKLQPESDHESVRSSLCMRYRGDLHLVPIQDIYYFLADHKYVTVKTSVREYLIEEPLKDLEVEFSEKFMRIHRNALVSLNHIAELQKDRQGQLMLAFQGLTEQLVVSRRHAPEVRSRFKALDSK